LWAELFLRRVLGADCGGRGASVIRSSRAGKGGFSVDRVIGAAVKIDWDANATWPPCRRRRANENYLLTYRGQGGGM
jgi:hypothetical protein